MSYFLLEMTEDGLQVRSYTDSGRLQKDLAERATYRSGLRFMQAMPPNYWDWNTVGDGTVMIIKGEIIVPEVVQVVREFKV